MLQALDACYQVEPLLSAVVTGIAIPFVLIFLLLLRLLNFVDKVGYGVGGSVK